ERRHRVRHPPRARRIIVILCLWITPAVSADIRQPVRRARIGPPIRREAHVIVLVPTRWNTLLLRDRERPRDQRAVGVAQQPLQRRTKYAVAALQGCLGERQLVRAERNQYRVLRCRAWSRGSDEPDRHPQSEER